MDTIFGSTRIGQQVLPRIVPPVVVAIVVTLLWAITGWSWFDVGVWPWALASVPVALLLAVRLFVAVGGHTATRSRVEDVVGALHAVGSTLDGKKAGSASSVVGALRLFRHRFAPGPLLSDLREVLSEEVFEEVRSARDPQKALMDAIERDARQAKVDVDAHLSRARSALMGLQRTRMGETFALSSEIVFVFLVTAPIGLVTTTGWWTFAVVAGISIAYLALDALARDLEEPPGSGFAWQDAQAMVLAAERDLHGSAGGN